MFERLPEAVRIGLEAIYSDADVVTGVEVTYTVNFSIYGINGTKDTTVYTVKYVVTGKAEFEYVEDSLKAIVEHGTFNHKRRDSAMSPVFCDSFCGVMK